MLWWSFMCLLLLGWLVGIGEGYGPEEHLVKRLPGQPRVGFRQYAGYVDIDLEAGRSLFYYFVEAEVESDKKPLTLWLSGGPGCSSIGGGAFIELGPFFPRGDGRTLGRNPHSWNKASNLLFVESPAGVGWSYSNTTTDYTTGDASTANDMLIFMIKWVKMFPVFQARDLFLAGESYAGHYIPQLAVAILEHNEKSFGAPLNVKGVAVGNPLLKAGRITISAQMEYLWSHGMYSDETYQTIRKECDFDLTHNESEACDKAIYGDKNTDAYLDNYDVLVDVCYPAIVEQELRLRKMATMMSVGIDVCIEYEMTFYLNLAEVQEALHANRTKLPYSWAPCHNGPLNYSNADMLINILPLLKHIMQNDIPVWIYSGDQDSTISFIGSRTLARELAHESHFEATVPYGAWFHKGQVGGWAIEYGNLLTFATVRGAGHMVPYTQPARALHLFSSFVRGRRLPNTTTMVTMVELQEGLNLR